LAIVSLLALTFGSRNSASFFPSDDLHAGQSAQITPHRRQLHIHFGQGFLHALHACAGLLPVFSPFPPAASNSAYFPSWPEGPLP
jgi:hypothetical protein